MLVELQFGAEDVFRCDDSVERGEDHLARRRRNHEEGEADPVDPARHEFDQRRNVVAQADAPAGLLEMLATHPAELGVVADQVGQFAPLLHQVRARQPVDFVLERRGADQLTQDQAGVVNKRPGESDATARPDFSTVSILPLSLTNVVI